MRWAIVRRRGFVMWLLLASGSISSSTGLAQNAAALAQNATVLFDMDLLSHAPGEFTGDKNDKHAAGTATLVPGKFKQAVEFKFTEGARGGFMTGRLRPTPAWDQTDGFSFWVRGDGSQSFGGIELIDQDDFGLRYGYCFPIDSTEWRQITVRWSDLTPELASPLVDAKAGYAPSKFGQFWFGKWYYWRDYPAASYSIDQVVLEPKIERPTQIKAEPGLARVRAKLQRHEPVTIVTMGDSLSDERHWANREVLWSKLLVKSLHEKYHSDVTLVNPAIGGTTLSQNIVQVPRWAAQTPRPDLVTICFGFNDWDTGVRGPRFAEYLRLAIERVRRATGGSADILLITSCPAFDRWESMAEMEQAVRSVAKEQGVGLADIAAPFRQGRTPDEALKQELWVWDKVHLGPRGHQLVSDTALSALVGK